MSVTPPFLDAPALAARLPDPAWAEAIYAILRSLRIEDYGIADVRIDEGRRRVWLDLRNPHPDQGQWLPLSQCIPFKALAPRTPRQAEQRQNALTQVEAQRQAVVDAQARRDAVLRQLEAEQAHLAEAQRQLEQAHLRYLQSTGLGG